MKNSLAIVQTLLASYRKFTSRDSVPGLRSKWKKDFDRKCCNKKSSPKLANDRHHSGDNIKLLHKDPAKACIRSISKKRKNLEIQGINT